MEKETNVKEAKGKDNLYKYKELIKLAKEFPPPKAPVLTISKEYEWKANS